jgi:translation initiation factor 4E
LWEHKASESKSSNAWKENMCALCSFQTVEEFWKYVNHIPTPSQVFYDGEYRTKVDGKTIEEYSLFKKGIEPEWGDPRNVVGGEWFCRQSFDGESLDLYWQNLVLAGIGETMETVVNNESLTSFVNGVRVVDKSRAYPMFKMELWLSTRDPTERDRILQHLQELMTGGGASNSRKTQPKWEWKDHSG